MTEYLYKVGDVVGYNLERYKVINILFRILKLEKLDDGTVTFVVCEDVVKVDLKGE